MQSSLAQGPLGSQRVSTEPVALAGTHCLLSGQATTLGKTSFGAVAEEDYPNSTEYIDDEEFEEISYDELRLSIYPADPAHLASLFGE